MSYHPAAASALPRLGRYELLGHLATGGMAEIHLARLAGDEGFEKTVVVKRLLPELVASKAFVAMFVEEAKLAARLDHPNVCDVYELGREGAEYFIVMPYLDGIPATDLLAPHAARERSEDLRVATGVIAQACAGLHHAHELCDAGGAPLGLVHRDVSPSNLFVTTSGVVKVLDFGIAKVRGATETEAGTIKGKTQYMAPEQLLGQPLDRRCDVFALGIVLFELVTHRRLFERSSDYLAARAILEEPIPRADAVDASVPPALADVIDRALARDREARLPDARAFARALEDAMRASRGIASAEEIAASLRAGHHAELEAQRTRQLRIVADARSRTDHAASSPTSPPTSPPASDVATRPVLPRSRARRPRLFFALAATTIVAGGGGLVVWQLAVRDSDGRISDGRISDGRISDGRISDGAQLAGRIPDDAPPVVREPDAVAPVTPIAQPPDGRKSDTSARHSKPGTFSIDSTPFATIYEGDHELGMTPLIHHALSAGHHKLRAQLRDGRSKTIEVDVPAGKAAKPIQLMW